MFDVEGHVSRSTLTDQSASGAAFRNGSRTDRWVSGGVSGAITPRV